MTNIHLRSCLAQLFLEWGMLQSKVVEKIKTYILYSVTFYFLKNRAVYDIMWKNIAEPDRQQMTIWRMFIARWTHKSTDAQSEYVRLFQCNSGYANAFQCYVIRTYVLWKCDFFGGSVISRSPDLHNFAWREGYGIPLHVLFVQLFIHMYTDRQTQCSKLYNSDSQEHVCILIIKQTRCINFSNLFL